MERQQSKEMGPVLQGSCKPISDLPSWLNLAIPELPSAAPACIDLLYEMYSMYHLCMQSANYSLQFKSSLLSVFTNKVLLTHSHAYSLCTDHGLFPGTRSELYSCNGDCMASDLTHMLFLST